MGWSFNSNPDQTKSSFVAELIDSRRLAPGWEMLEHRVVGNHLWILLRDPSGAKRISLELMQKERGGGWGHKGVDEAAGPYHYDCPLSLLDRCTDPVNEWSAGWREKVRAHHADKARKAALETGSVIRYGGHEYRLHSPLGPRKGWHVIRRGDGQSFRMSAQKMARSEVVL